MFEGLTQYLILSRVLKNESYCQLLIYITKREQRTWKTQFGEFDFKFVWKIYTNISTQAWVMCDAFPRKEQNHNCEAMMQVIGKLSNLMIYSVFWFSLR